jgi:Domain of unknown function (DUF4349)
MRRRVFLAGSVLAVLAIGACSHSSGGASDAGGIAARGHAVAGAAGGNGNQSAVSGSAPLSRTAKSDSIGSVPLDDGAAKIRTADMTVTVKGWRNVATKADEADAIALRTGGEVDSDNRTSGKHATATLLLRVPTDTLTETLTELSRLGHEEARHSSTTDVTEKVADVDARAASARKSIARLQTLFNHARKIENIIAIESELSSREADLESLEAQQRALTRQTSMAAITLSLVTARKAAAPPPKHEKKHRGGFVGGLERGWDGFTAAASWLATVVGTLLPFLVLLLVLALAGRLLWPRLPHRPGPAPSPSDG